MMAHGMPGQPPILGSTSLFAALTVSLVGFLGYYTQNGFVSFPPAIVLSLQLLFLLAGAYFLRHHLAAGIYRIWPILAFSAWAFATSVISEDIIALRRAAIILTPGVLMCLLAILDPKPHQTFIRFTRLLTAISLLSAGFALLLATFGSRNSFSGEHILQLWNSPNAPGMQIGWRTIEAFGIKLQRPSGFTGNANSLGIITSLALICEVIRCMMKQKLSSRDLLIFFLLALTLASTVSRSALLFLFIAAAFLAIHYIAKLKRLAISAMTLIVAVPMVISALIVSGLIDAATSSPPYTAGSVAHLYEAFHLRDRATIWAQVYDALGDYWLVGAGFSLIQEKVFSPLDMQTAAHSVPLSILIETGVIGLGLMLMAWFLPVVRAILHPITPPLLAGVTAILVALYGHQIFDSSIFRYHFLHFVFCYFLGTISNPALLSDNRNAHVT